MHQNWKLLVVSIVGTGLLWGCVGGEGDYTQLKPEENVANPDDHAHPAHGPNGGHILELGAVHGELAMGADRVVSLYLLGEDAKTPAPLANASAKLHLHLGAEEKEIELTAAPLEGEADGQTSRFTAAADAVPAAIADIEGIEGEVILTIDGKETVVEVGHSHEGHAH